MIAPEFAEDPEFRERFQDEWRAAGGLDHPAIVPVYQAGEEGGRLFVVMRFVEGTDLRALIDRERVLAPGRAIAIIEQIAGALDEAHRHGLIHRDVKPANILIMPDGQGRDRAFLTDFGLTRHATSAVARRTNTGPVGRHSGLHRARAGRGQARSTAAPTSTRWAACSTRR